MSAFPHLSEPLTDGGVVLRDLEIAQHATTDIPIVGYTAASLTDSLTLLYSHRYLNDALMSEIARAQEKMFRNLMANPPPAALISQYLPMAYAEVRDGSIGSSPAELAN